jgi:adenylate kinase
LLVLDGIPRTVRQAELLEKHIRVLTIVHLTCKDEKAMFERLRKRALKENRIDDADEKVIRRRWGIYEKETRPVLEFYPSRLIYDVDSIGSPATVLMRILDHLAPLQDRHFADAAL